MKSNKPKLGFTLIELLVVIAIIAILAAILFPVFASAKKQANQAACVSNVKQIGYAFLMYAQDWNGACPPLASTPKTFTYTYDSRTFQTGTWITNQAHAALLDRYMKTKRYLCPCDLWNKGIEKSRDSAGNHWPFYTSYGYNNIHLAHQTWYGDYIPGYTSTARMDTIKAQSRTVAFADKDMRNEPVLRPPNCPAYGLPSEFTCYACIGHWHNDGANVDFVDGHVKWMNTGPRGVSGPPSPLTTDETLWTGK